MNQPVLVDSSFLYALYDEDDRGYQAAVHWTYHANPTFIIPDVVLTEVAFLFRRAGGTLGVVKFLEALHNAESNLEPIIRADLKQARNIMIAYPTAHLDFVDCAIMALSERLNITQVCTYDRRDFAIFRPKHCPYLELLP